MAIIQGISGGISGKMGNAVFRQRYGETVLTQYQPHVANPNSDGQVAQRAKFKLVSQLAAVLGDYVAIPRRGSVTGRNVFSSINLPNVQAEARNGVVEKVSLDVLAVKLTDSNKPAPTLVNCTVTDRGGVVVDGLATLSVSNRNPRQRDKSVSLVVVKIAADNPFEPVVVADYVATPDENGLFTAQFNIPDALFAAEASYVVYAYEAIALATASSEFYDSLASQTSGPQVATYFLDLISRANFGNVELSDTVASFAASAV